MQLERDPDRSRDKKRKGGGGGGRGERGKLTLLFILVVLFLVSYYPCDRMHPSIALWESKERIFRENARRRENISPARVDCSSVRHNPLSSGFRCLFIMPSQGSSLRNLANLKLRNTSRANKNNSSIGKNTRRASSMLSSLPPFRLFFYIPLTLSFSTYIRGRKQMFLDGFKLQNFRDALQTS